MAQRRRGVWTCTLLILLAHIPTSVSARSAPQRSAVVVLGYDPDGFNWERVVWGEPQTGLLGRVPQGVLVAESMDAELLVLGDGIVPSAEPRDADPDASAPVALLEQRLPGLCAFGGGLAALSEDVLRALILPRCVALRGARNTRDEIARALAMCSARGCTRVVLVSSPAHIPRCARDACALLEAIPALRAAGLTVLVCASGTSFSEEEGADAVAIVEPPHRGGDGLLRSEERAAAAGGESERDLALHRLVVRVLRLDARARSVVCAGLAELLDTVSPEQAALPA